jgi:DNA repair protein RadC
MGTAKNIVPLSPLQEKFLKSGLKDMSEPEILELLLSVGTPDKDYRRLSGRIISRYKSIKDMLRNSPEQIRQIPGVSNRVILVISIFRDITQKYLVERLLERPIYQTGREIYEHYYHEMIDARSEHFKMLCLDKAKRITGELDLLTIKPDSSIAQSSRAAIEYAIKHGAMYFIVAHNHLSGDPKPSQADIDITRDLVFAGLIIQIKLLDHVIIGKDNFFSFSNEGLIQEYEAEFQSLKLRGTAEAKRRLNTARKTAGKD